MQILTLITARGGSKRLPGKNILPLGNKPLIAWTIEAAQKSKYTTKIVVSTDDHEIAQIAKEYSAEVPFIRPDYLANDTATSFDVIMHALNFFEKTHKFDYILLLQPTSPLRTAQDIDNAIESLIKRKEKSIVSVCEMEHSPLWCNTLPKNLSMKNFIKPEIKNKRSQELPLYYRLNGAIYISEIQYFINNKGFMGNETYAYIMDRKKSIDIDTIEDLNYVKFLLNNNS